jgi:hypothetical protein
MKALTITLAVLCTCALAAPAARADYDMLGEQWEVNTLDGTFLASGDYIRLHNVDVESRVVYGEREYGINLLWRDTSAREWWVRTAPSGPNPGGQNIQYTERFALYNASAGAYVKYGWREYGINLVWSEDPVYEWSIEGHDGWERFGSDRSVRSNDYAVGLFNHNPDEFLVYGERDYGIDLTWWDTLSGDYSN